MPITTQKIVPCLWFDTKGEEAARFYVSIFPNSRMGEISRYGEEGFEIHGREAGTVMTVEFFLDGQRFVALNGGPLFTFDEAVSFQIHCADQKEIDHYWEKLTDGGEEGPCGWLKDRFGLSWQVVPKVLLDMVMSKDHAASQRVTKAFLQMKKFDIEALKRAYDGEVAGAK